MEELVKINENEKGDILINGRELHQFLEGSIILLY